MIMHTQLNLTSACGCRGYWRGVAVVAVLPVKSRIISIDLASVDTHRCRGGRAEEVRSVGTVGIRTVYDSNGYIMIGDMKLRTLIELNCK